MGHLFQSGLKIVKFLSGLKMISFLIGPKLGYFQNGLPHQTLPCQMLKHQPS
jgi:hypothetical protein